MAADFPRRPPAPPVALVAEEDERPPSVWPLIWTIYFAKLATIVLIIWASHSYETAALVAATTWPWLVLAVALGAGPLLFHLRLRRVRARRELLERAEWMLCSPRTHRRRDRRLRDAPR
jgi:hypothetical protein